MRCSRTKKTAEAAAAELQKELTQITGLKVHTAAAAAESISRESVASSEIRLVYSFG